MSAGIETLIILYPESNIPCFVVLPTVIGFIFDDRNESAGKKFSDGDLIGIPFQLIIGPRELKNGNIELKNRKTNDKEILSFEKAVDKIKCKIFEE